MRGYVTLPQAARELGVSRETAWRWASRGLLPAVRFGRVYAVPLAALDEVKRRVLPRPVWGRLLPAELLRRGGR